jgi:cytochrome c7-like protein
MRRPRTRLGLAAAATLALALALGACREQRAAAPPKVTDKLIFSHDFHKNLDVECEVCHEGITKAPDLAKSYLPKEAKCLECHAEHKESKDCAFCHSDPERPASYAATHIRDVNVPHAKHVEQKVACEQCHTKLAESDQPRPAPPTMEACTSCHKHEQDFAQARCAPCHKDLTRFPIRPVAMYNHGGRFLAEHAGAARTGAEACAQCHDQTYCADCHAKTVSTRVEVRFPEDVSRDFIHRGDYLSRHTIDAKADSASCNRCHGTSFCQSCHQMEGLIATLDASSLNGRDPHPPGWAMRGGAQFHGDAARRDIASCAACHDQGAVSVCVKCHRVGGVGGNPHPLAFTNRHGQDEISKNTMCRTCHL